MRRVGTCLAMAAALSIMVWSKTPAYAQQVETTTQRATDISEFYRQWQQEQDPEQKIAIGERILALERATENWPLATARAQFKSEIWFGVGSAYVSRLAGVRADNLERGITLLEEALTVWTKEVDPQNWARAHNNLGIAYWARIRGERPGNQDRAISHFEAALAVLTREAAAQEWAQLQNNLAIVYVSRVHGNRTANIESAIANFEAALKVFSREKYPREWANVQNNLASAYRNRTQGERADNRETAIAHFEAALTVLTREAFAFEWATAQSNLAAAYLDRTRGQPVDNQNKAIALLEATLTVLTRERTPQQWATAQRTAGNAYANRIKGTRKLNNKKATAHYEFALQVFTRAAFPQEHMRTSRNLGRVRLEAGEFAEAGAAYADAREAFLLLFGQGLEEDEARTVIADAGPLFSEAAYAALQRGESEAALTLASEGRARLLAVALKLQSLDLPAGQRQRLDSLRIAIRDARQNVDAAVGTGRAATLERLAELRQELLGLVNSASPGEVREASEVAEAQSLVAAGGAVVMPIVTGLGGKIMVITNTTTGSGMTVIDLPQLTTQRLSDLLAGSSKNRKSAGWLAAYFVNYLEGPEKDRRWPEWLAAVDSLGPELWRLLGARLDATLKERGVKPGARLMWLPSGWLGVLPLGLSQNPDSGRRLADDYEIVYAPTLAAFASARDADKPRSATLAAVINPTGDLAGTETEGAIVASYFASGARTLLQREAATSDAVIAALKGRTYWHFASHGTFAWGDPRQSALLMHEGARLSVGQLLETTGLGHPRLVVLSACETGLTEISNNPDEFIGLPGAFTALGATGVVGTLWPVSDAATAVLIAKFYDLHLDGLLSPPAALHRSQAWLRDATNDDLTAYAANAADRGRLAPAQIAEIARALSVDELTRSRNRKVVQWVTRNDRSTIAAKSGTPKRLARPYAHPYFWAGFIYTGR